MSFNVINLILLSTSIIYLDFYRISKIQPEILSNFKIKLIDHRISDIIVVSAYFPLERSKRNQSEYKHLIRYFLRVMNCQTLIYTTKKFYNEYYINELNSLTPQKQRLYVFNCTFDDIFEVPCVKNLKETYQKVNEIDPENFRHNPRMYAIWNSKVYFVREATLIYPEAKFYFWVDSGVVRDPLYFNQFDDKGHVCKNGGVKCHYLNFPSKKLANDILKNYVNPPLELCLFMLLRRRFPKHSHVKIRNDLIQGGGFFGTKVGIHKFYDAFWEVHNSWLNNSIFCGKEQEIYNHVFSNYYDKINIYIYPAFRGHPSNMVWKMFISAFSEENPHKATNKLMKSNSFLRQDINVK